MVVKGSLAAKHPREAFSWNLSLCLMIKLRREKRVRVAPCKNWASALTRSLAFPLLFSVSTSRSYFLFAFVFTCVLSTARRGRPFDSIGPWSVSPPPPSLHFASPAFPLRLRHSTGPSCVEASLSASRRCHRNLGSHGRLWAPSARISVVFTQRTRAVG